ncbi:spore coat protein [Anaerobacillus sp. 1_MG-2023]|uniref:spore coat protein n=1 Tax=Bacillales TaxID=1385 RepID=UPI0026E466C8|nr:spore coat protein [Anaerobacillus sp. 1_MG-2023]MDO6655438.1 spore coat protein [Anaerobacillus sp. 1_MG-2023]
MNEKDMVNDYLSVLNSSLSNYGSVISQADNPQLRQALQQIRNTDEQRQYNLYQYAKQKGYYQPAAPAQTNEIQQVKNQLTAPQQQQNNQPPQVH